MLRKSVALFVSFVLLLGYCTLPAGAITTTDNVIVYDQERLSRIDELQRERVKLSLHYEDNIAAINEITNELTSLGVEEVSYQEVAAKSGHSVSPRVAVTSTSTILWTSTTAIVNYWGEFYELQIITGEPRPGVSGTLTSTPSISLKKNYSAAIGALSASKVVLSATAGYLPQVGSYLSGAQTLYDAASAFIDGISPTTVISGTSAVYSISMLAMEKFIYIKAQGNADSTQICGYAGNSVAWSVGVNLPITLDKDGDGKAETDVIQFSYDDTMIGPGYNNSYEIASKNFYNYRQGLQTFLVDYRMLVVRVNLLYNQSTGTGFLQNIHVPQDEMSFLG